MERHNFTVSSYRQFTASLFDLNECFPTVHVAPRIASEAFSIESAFECLTSTLHFFHFQGLRFFKKNSKETTFILNLSSFSTRNLFPSSSPLITTRYYFGIVPSMEMHLLDTITVVLSSTLGKRLS